MNRNKLKNVSQMRHVFKEVYSRLHHDKCVYKTRSHQVLISQMISIASIAYTRASRLHTYHIAHILRSVRQYMPKGSAMRRLDIASPASCPER